MPNASAQQERDLPAEDIRELAALLAPAVHIDAAFLRNFRNSRLPSTDTGLEARFWYSDLVASRSSSVITLDWEQVEGLGKAAFMASPERFRQGWSVIDELHRNLPGNLRLQEALRYAAITDEPIGELVACIHHTLSDLTDVEQRRSLGRWLKAALPELPDAEQETLQVQWLAAVARAELGDAPTLFYPQEYARAADIPDWLFPEREIRSEHTIGLQLTPGVLSILGADQNAALLPLDSDKPTLLRVTWEVEGSKTGGWLKTAPGNQLAIDPRCRHVEIFVPDGRRFRLWYERQQDHQAFQREYVLLYLPEDRHLAETLQDLLQDHNIGIELREETSAGAGRDFPDRPVICLWTRHAVGHWQELSKEKGVPLPGVLLRTDASVSLPRGAGAADAIDLLDLQDADGLERAINKLHDIEQARLEEKRNSLDSAQMAAPIEVDRPYSAEVRRLLDEIEDPKTSPRRRLVIGDRLAELGDPRPGVGVYAAEVAETQAESPTETEAATVYPPKVQDLLDKINNSETTPKRRLAIGDELARLGDPRPGVGLDARGLPDIDWVEIPAGPFIYGEGKSQKEIELERFQVSRYPITNAQYQAFIDAGGYEKQGWLKKLTGVGRTDVDWWQDLKQPEPEKSRWDLPNRPRTNVDWYEAVAFTRWLSDQLNQPIRLPTEQEWEKAARGTDGRRYPWGNEYINGYANVNESGSKGEYLQQTTAVGLYPMDNSPYGVRDLAGNVWEWCLNKYEHPEQIGPDASGDGRVLRGGSWIVDPDDARAADRLRDAPELPLLLQGFSGGVVCPHFMISCPLLTTAQRWSRFFRAPCRSGPCPRSLVGAGSPGGFAGPSIAPMGRSYKGCEPAEVASSLRYLVGRATPAKPGWRWP